MDQDLLLAPNTSEGESQAMDEVHSATDATGQTAGSDSITTLADASYNPVTLDDWSPSSFYADISTPLTLQSTNDPSESGLHHSVVHTTTSCLDDLSPVFPYEWFTSPDEVSMGDSSSSYGVPFNNQRFMGPYTPYFDSTSAASSHEVPVQSANSSAGDSVAVSNEGTSASPFEGDYAFRQLFYGDVPSPTCATPSASSQCDSDYSEISTETSSDAESVIASILESRESSQSTVGPDRRKKHKCKLCSESFTRRNDRVRHMESVHDKQRFDCEKCGKSYSRRDALKRHKQKSKHFD